MSTPVVYTGVVERQLEALVDRYLEKGYVSAANKLLDTVDGVIRRFSEHGAPKGRDFPSVYREIAAAGFRWYREHDYWFGYVTRFDGTVVITNIIHAKADMARRVVLDDGTVFDKPAD